MEKLSCSKCGDEKEVSFFKRDFSKKRGYSVWCRDCNREYDKLRYIEKKSDLILMKNKRRVDLRNWMVELKSKLVCSKCGEDHPACLEFHHTDSSAKENNISTLTGRGYSIKKIEEEIDKCVVLCSNCHRKFHFEEKQRVIG